MSDDGRIDQTIMSLYERIKAWAETQYPSRRVLSICGDLRLEYTPVAHGLLPSDISLVISRLESQFCVELQDISLPVDTLECEIMVSHETGDIQLLNTTHRRPYYWY